MSDPHQGHGPQGGLPGSSPLPPPPGSVPPGPPAGGTASDDGSNRTPLVVALVGLVLIIVIALVVVLVGGSDDPTIERADTPAPSLTLVPTTDDRPDDSPDDPAIDESTTTQAEEDPADDDGSTGDVSVEGAPLPESAGVGGSTPDDPALGESIPTITGFDLDGAPMTIGPGEPQVIVMMAHWCPHCQDEIPRIVDWVEGGMLPDGVSVVGISTAVDELRGNYPPVSWLERERWGGPVLADDELSTAFGALGGQSFPTIIAVDADGIVTGRYEGEADEATFVALAESALGR